MNFFKQQPGSHPTPELLALYSGGDLPPVRRLLLKRHAARCRECERQIEAFNCTRSELKREAAGQTLTAFEAIVDWKSLEREMLGNIVVGVAAARCIANVGRKSVWIPRTAMAAGLTALFAAGWVTHIPGQQTHRLAESILRFCGIQKPVRALNFVRTTPTGIAVHSQDVTLTILHPPSAVVSLSGRSSVEARYVDEDTGQVTITNVYGQ